LLKQIAVVAAVLITFLPAQTPDPRSVRAGWPIPDENYSDQPYVVVTGDGNWLCVMTTGQGVEGRFLRSRNILKVALSDGSGEAAHNQMWTNSATGYYRNRNPGGQWQHVAVTVDGGPKIVTFVIDGQFNDGDATRQFGWGRFPAGLDDVNGAATAKVAPLVHGEMKLLRLYNRYLLTSEAVGNHRAGL
jgi:hypothetical protein